MIRILFSLIVITLLSCSSNIQPDPVYRETVVRGEREKVEGEIFDPQESIKSLTHIFSEADIKAERKVGNVKRDENFIHLFWQEKKRILNKHYGIVWKSPAELNPEIEYGGYGQPKISDKEASSIENYLRSLGYLESEAILSIRRGFNGEVSLYSETRSSNQLKQYTLNGVGERWKLISEFIVE